MKFSIIPLTYTHTYISSFTKIHHPPLDKDFSKHNYNFKLISPLFITKNAIELKHIRFPTNSTTHLNN